MNFLRKAKQELGYIASTHDLEQAYRFLGLYSKTNSSTLVNKEHLRKCRKITQTNIDERIVAHKFESNEEIVYEMYLIKAKTVNEVEQFIKDNNIREDASFGITLVKKRVSDDRFSLRQTWIYN